MQEVTEVAQLEFVKSATSDQLKEFETDLVSTSEIQQKRAADMIKNRPLK
jgi:hypothetical protein